MASSMKTLQRVLYRGRVLTPLNGLQYRSISNGQFRQYWQQSSSLVKGTVASVVVGGGAVAGGKWFLDRVSVAIDNYFKQTTGTRLALEAKEDYENLKYHVKESKIPEKEYIPVRIDRSDLHLKMAQSIAEHTINSSKPRVIIVSDDKGLGKSTAFKAGARLFVNALFKPKAHPEIKISTNSVKEYKGVFILYLNFEQGPKSALKDLDIRVRSDLDAIEALDDCFRDAKANKYCILLLLDAPGGVLKHSTLDVQQRFRRMCKSVTGSGFGRIYAVTSPAGVAVFTDGTELNEARREQLDLKWFRASQQEQLMLIDGFMTRAKTGKSVDVKKGKSYEDSDVMSKYELWKNKAPFVNGNIDEIGTFLDDELPKNI